MLISCTKTEILPDLKGNMVGYVYTFDEFTVKLDDHSGVLVKALGKSNTYQTSTNKMGRFEFKNIPAGTYELQFLKDGYGTLKQFGIQHLGGEPTVLNMVFDPYRNGSAYFLYELPATEISDLRIENDSVYCKFLFQSLQPESIYLQLFISLQENFEPVSDNLILTNFRLQKRGDIYSGPLYYLSPFETHPGLPFKTGEKVFFKACISPFYGSTITLFNQLYITGTDTYFDYENNRVVYPALGKESAQNSYIVP
jgi:hypothetical protein